MSQYRLSFTILQKIQISSTIEMVIKQSLAVRDGWLLVILSSCKIYRTYFFVTYILLAGFLDSMLPQYMAFSVSQFCQCCQCVKKNLKCNISLTEAQIFMKFETYVYKIVLDHQPNFHKDPCKDARARGVNARTHVKKNLCVRSLG